MILHLAIPVEHWLVSTDRRTDGRMDRPTMMTAHIALA